MISGHKALVPISKHIASNAANNAGVVSNPMNKYCPVVGAAGEAGVVCATGVGVAFVTVQFLVF